jgi:hypothetical protein
LLQLRTVRILQASFYGKQYVGYSAGSVWEIYGRHGYWRAKKIVGPIVGKTKLLIGYDTLAEISEELTKLEKEE